MKARVFFLCAAILFSVFSGRAAAQSWKVQTSGIDSNLRAVSAVHVSVEKRVPTSAVWVSGSNGVVAFSDKTAYLMSSGEGEKSRIYKTTDGGETWKLQYSDNRKEFFLDTITCISEKECLALGDPIHGKFLLLKTADGNHWNPLAAENMPQALGGEGAFAASNTCLALSGEKEVFFGTGGPAARIFHSTDGGFTWNVTRTPILQGNPSSGIFSLAADKRSEERRVGKEC